MLANFALGAIASIAFVVVAHLFFPRFAWTFMGVEQRRARGDARAERREAA